MLHSILLLASFAVGVPELPWSAYVDTEVSTNFPIVVEDDGKHCMEDWNGGCNGTGSSGARYYPSGTFHRDIIRRMLMNGNVERNTAEREPGFDITCGSVYGYDRNGELGDVNTGFFHGTASE